MTLSWRVESPPTWRDSNASVHSQMPAYQKAMHVLVLRSAMQAFTRKCLHTKRQCMSLFCAGQKRGCGCVGRGQIVRKETRYGLSSYFEFFRRIVACGDFWPGVALGFALSIRDSGVEARLFPVRIGPVINLRESLMRILILWPWNKACRKPPLLVPIPSCRN
jgi:hypothetical protein